MSDIIELDTGIVFTNDLTFECDNYFVSKRQAEITYKEPIFIEQFHTLTFKIDGKEYRFERK